MVANDPIVASMYLVSFFVILDANEYGFAFACYEYVFFLEYIDALLRED